MHTIFCLEKFWVLLHESNICGLPVVEPDYCCEALEAYFIVMKAGGCNWETQFQTLKILGKVFSCNKLVNYRVPVSVY